MLLETSKAPVTTSSNQRSSLVNKPLIEILSHDDDQSTEKNAYFEGGPNHANRTKHGLDVADEDDDDDAPPPIHFHGNYSVKNASMQNDVNNMTNQNELDATAVPKAVSITPNNSIETNESTCSIPLAEQMMAEAQRAKEVQSTQKNKQERSKAQKATCGFQKGFLNSSKKSSKKRKNSKSSNLVAKSCQARDGDNESTKEDEKQDVSFIVVLDFDYFLNLFGFLVLLFV